MKDVDQAHQVLGRRGRTQSGFTLIEIMIVVVILGVLAGIAYASYQNQVVKSRRKAAAVCLQERAQFMERYYTTNMTYTGAPAPDVCDDGLRPFYTIRFDPAAAPAAKTYTLQAVPQGIQASKDGACGTLSLNAQGVRGKTGSASSVSDCW